MSEKTIADVLDKSIDKLSGGAAEIAKAAKQVAPHAWEVAVREQRINGALGIAVAALLFALAVCSLVALLVSRKEWRASLEARVEAEHKRDLEIYGESYARTLREKALRGTHPHTSNCLMVSAFALAASVTVFCAYLSQFANPEFHAAKAILDAVK